VTLGAGDQYSSAALQYGGKLGDDLDIASISRIFISAPSTAAGGTTAHDDGTGRRAAFGLTGNAGQDGRDAAGAISIAAPKASLASRIRP